MVTTDRVREIYERHVRPRTNAKRLQLMALGAQRLADEAKLRKKPPVRNIMELHGVGRDSWDGTDAQEFVNNLRAEWDHRP